MTGSAGGGTGAPARRRGALARFRDLPLSWKLLLPSVGLIVVLGIVGGFLIVRDLSARSQAALDLELSRRSLDARSVLRDGELSLIESVNFAANIEGIAEAIEAGDAATSARLLQSVVALKPDIEVLAVTGLDGRALVEFGRSRPDARPRRSDGRAWSEEAFVRRALRDPEGTKAAGFTTAGPRSLLGIAAPVCSDTSTCDPVGTAIVGFGVERIANEALRRMASAADTPAGVTVFDATGRIVASAGPLAPPRSPQVSADERTVRRNERIDGTDAATLFAQLDAGGRPLGTIGVSVSVGPTLASVQRTGLGLGLILLAAMAGIAVIGVLLSRLILRQVRSLVATNRALGRGDLSARAHVDWNDEIGELGMRLNEMAEQLQAMYETLESRVAERTEEVERLLQERTEFFASVSHELRTPLAVILRHAEMLLDDAYRGNGRWRIDAGTALKDSGGQLSRLIDDILELAEVEAGRLGVDLEPVNVSEFLQEMRSTIEPLARGAGLRAAIRVRADEIPPVIADRRRLRQIILNLVDNAVKYTPEGGRVEITAEAHPDLVEVSVADTGVGIPPGAGERLFEPFYRVKGTRTQRGQASSGLGLAVARRLVEAHGGAITYASRPHGGTIFTFSLQPAAEVSGSPAKVGSTEDEHPRDA